MNKTKNSIHRLKNIWCLMKKRCNNKNDKIYKYYGARGIEVCNEWKNNSSAFIEWALKNGYKDDLTIDRIDVNGNYQPDNCRWVTQKVQHRNTRSNRYITFNDNTHCLAEWAEILHINKSSLWNRFKKGWSIEKALTTPINIKYRHKGA